MTKQFLTVLLTLLVLLVPSYSLACDPGDTQKGPNCVHQESVDRYTVVSTVYRGEGDSKDVVWKEVGEVKESTEDYLVVFTMVMTEDGNQWQDAKFPWDDAKGRYSYTAE